LVLSDTDEEENLRPGLSVDWNWKESVATIQIWKYSELHGVTNDVLDRLNTPNVSLDLFFTLFDDNFWDMVVTQTNLYAEQIMSNGRRRKVDNNWFPVTKN
jgi:hypothetical protein